MTKNTCAAAPRDVVFALAAEASAHPRTVAKVLRGEAVKGAVGYRIATAAAKLGIALP